MDPGIYRGICDHSAGVSEDSASSLEGLRALQVAKFLQNGGGCQKLGGKNILLLEKIGWVGIFFLPCRFSTILSGDFFVTPPGIVGKKFSAY